MNDKWTSELRYDDYSVVGSNFFHISNVDFSTDKVVVEYKYNAETHEISLSLNGDIINSYIGLDKELTLDPISIGRHISADNQGFKGDIFEIIVAKSLNKTTEINYYLSNKWYLTSTVDSDGDGNVDNLDTHPTDPDLGGKTNYVENFNEFVAGDLEGQNNWKVIKQYTSNGIQVVSDFGPDGSTALQFPYSGSGVQNSGYKIFDQVDDPLPFTNATLFIV